MIIRSPISHFNAMRNAIRVSLLPACCLHISCQFALVFAGAGEFARPRLAKSPDTVEKPARWGRNFGGAWRKITRFFTRLPLHRAGDRMPFSEKKRLKLLSLAMAQARFEKNVVYGMFSGSALFMDVRYPARPSGFGAALRMTFGPSARKMEQLER